jgi:Cys-tRNA(Pro) deacylase
MDTNSQTSTPVTRALDALQIPYRLFRHPGQVHSLEQAADERGQRPGQVVRSIVFRLSAEEFIMVLVAGPRQVSWPKLRAYLGLSRISMADPDEVLKVTGYPTGAVSPFGLPQPMRLIVDSSVTDEVEISIGSGIRNTTIILRQKDLLRGLPQAEIGAFTE